jgi:ketosteroid isomerase-like protein
VRRCVAACRRHTLALAEGRKRTRQPVTSAATKAMGHASQCQKVSKGGPSTPRLPGPISSRPGDGTRSGFGVSWLLPTGGRHGGLGVEGDEDEEVHPRESERRTGWTVPSWVVRTGSTLSLAALSVMVWEVETTLRLARLATDLAFRAPANLVGRAGELLGQQGGAAPNLAEEVNRALVLRLYRAVLQADLSTARTLFAEDAAWHVPRSEPAAGRYRGIAETLPALSAIWRELGTVEAVEVADVVVSPERAAALLRLSVVRSGRRATLDRWLMFRIDGGQVTQAWGPFSTEPRL